MKRMKLKLELLRVESFEVQRQGSTVRGTVRANVFEPYYRDMYHDESNALACASDFYHQCGGGTDGCVVMTEGCYYEVTPLC